VWALFLVTGGCAFDCANVRLGSRPCETAASSYLIDYKAAQLRQVEAKLLRALSLAPNHPGAHVALGSTLFARTAWLKASLSGSEPWR
jgi:hypothetical protein